MKPKFILFLLLLISLAVPFLLSTRIVGIGEGPDEMQHIDNAFFRLRKPGQLFEVEQGFSWPGYAPIGQGHQAPASYFIGAGLLRIFFRPAEVPAIVDYAAGISYSSEGAAFGEMSNCSYRLDRARMEETRSVRYGIYLLRGLGALYLMGTVYFAWRSGLIFFAGDKIAALVVAFFVLGVPTAIWRSVFFSNDNAVAFFSALTFFLALRILEAGREPAGGEQRTKTLVGLSIGAAVAAAVTFLCKYNGVVAFGFVVIAVFLSSGLRWRRRLQLSFIAAAIFSVTVLPDLISNLLVDGDLFSLPVVIRDVPYLYSPSSFFSVLGDGGFLLELFQRFWLEYHNSGSLQHGFPLWVHNIWIVVCLFAVLGLVRRFFLRIFRKGNGEQLHGGYFELLALVGVGSAVLVIVHFGATFPMPGGRYLHTALLPVACLIVCGWREILFFVFHQRSSEEGVLPRRALLMLGVGLASFSILFTSYFFYVRYADCLMAETGNVPAGISLAWGDFTGSKVDEIVVFHRLRGRVFFLSKEEGRWIPNPEIARKFTAETGFTREFTSATTVFNKILPLQFALCHGPVAVANSGQSAGERSVGNTPVFPPLYSRTLPQTSQPHDGLTCNIRAKPEMSRAVGLAGDKILAADVNGDGIDELLFWREVPGFLFAVDGRSFTRPDESLSVFPDRQVKPLLVAGSFPKRSKAQIFHDCNEEPRLITYEPSSGAATIFTVAHSGVEQISAHIESELMVEPGAEDIAAVCLGGELHLYLAHSAVGQINHRLLRDGSAKLVETIPGAGLIVEKHYGEGVDRLWRMNFEAAIGASCFSRLASGSAENEHFCLESTAGVSTAQQWLILSDERGVSPVSFDLVSGRLMFYRGPTKGGADLPASFELFAAP